MNYESGEVLDPRHLGRWSVEAVNESHRTLKEGSIPSGLASHVPESREG